MLPEQAENRRQLIRLGLRDKVKRAKTDFITYLLTGLNCRMIVGAFVIADAGLGFQQDFYRLRKRHRRGAREKTTEKCERDFLTLVVCVNNSNEIRSRRKPRFTDSTMRRRPANLEERWEPKVRISHFQGQSPERSKMCSARQPQVDESNALRIPTR